MGFIAYILMTGSFFGLALGLYYILKTVKLI
jgi:hypothetical protein